MKNVCVTEENERKSSRHRRNYKESREEEKNRCVSYRLIHRRERESKLREERKFVFSSQSSFALVERIQDACRGAERTSSARRCPKGGGGDEEGGIERLKKEEETEKRRKKEKRRRRKRTSSSLKASKSIA